MNNLPASPADAFREGFKRVSIPCPWCSGEGAFLITEWNLQEDQPMFEVMAGHYQDYQGRKLTMEVVFTHQCKGVPGEGTRLRRE